MNIKAIMCDVDGTILNEKGMVSPKTIEVIKKVREKGILFGLATGRDVHNTKQFLHEWGLEGLIDIIVGTGGGEIYDIPLGISTSNFPLDGDAIKEIVNHYEDMDVNFAIPYEGIFYTPKDDRHIQLLAQVDKVSYEVINYDEFLTQPMPKLMIVCDEDYMDKVVERSKTFHDDRYKCASLITASVLYEYMDPRISKANGLKEVMKLHGFGMDALCTFGDADNDYDMTLHAGVGVVMGNGSERTKSVADYITEDHNHDGIANFIETHILQRIDNLVYL